ncbi:hypothetical protein SUGI_0590870 [Cryptomeria japonica]|nr:hypothetical protein SUGI_0590870 [Cryptomeria japonica]
MAALDGSMTDTGDRSRVTDVRYSGALSMKVGSWSDEVDIAFPIETGWFCKAKHPTSEAPRNLYPLPEPSIFGAALERGNPHTDSFLAPSIDHGNFQKRDGRFRKDNSRVDQARFWRSDFCPKNQNPWSNHKRRPDFRREASLLQRPRFHKPWGGGKRVKDNFESWCRAQWGKDININILPNDFYMIEFMSNEEKWQAKNKGSYILDDIEVHIIDWQPNFNSRTHVLPDNKVWIRLYNCPLDYWHIDVIKNICKDLGTFVWANDILEDKLWGSFLRICISTDQITKIPDEVRIIGAGKLWIQKIDREDQLHICPKCFSLDHTGISCDVTAVILRSYSYIQSPIEVKLQPESPIVVDTREAFCNDTLYKENATLTEETPLIIVPPSSGHRESQQDLLTLLEKTKTLQGDIESKLVDSLPPSPFVPWNQLAIEDGNFHPQGMETDTIGEMGGQICSSIGIELEDSEIETSSSEGEEDFELDSDLILEGTSKGFGKSDSTVEKPNFKPKGVWGHKSKKVMLAMVGAASSQTKLNLGKGNALPQEQ